ncbi:type IV pilin protein [Sedimenticola sp.]|uniref:type IV pilin protein n=1 Tax=Sedimenticola sp. TaxID=1940285 RepID=UPI003D134DB2
MIDSKAHGFTLIEIMITLAIVGIISSIAYPSYVAYVERTRRSECQGVISNFALAMERFFAANSTYAGAANGGANTGTPAVSTFVSKCPLDGSQVYYTLSIQAASASSYTLRATPAGVQAGNGYLEVRSNGQKGWDRDNDGALAADELNWLDR